MFLFENTKNQNKSGPKIPPSAQIAEEAERITAQELDEYIRKGKVFGNEEDKTKKNSK